MLSKTRISFDIQLMIAQSSRHTRDASMEYCNTVDGITTTQKCLVRRNSSIATRILMYSYQTNDIEARSLQQIGYLQSGRKFNAVHGYRCIWLRHCGCSPAWHRNRLLAILYRNAEEWSTRAATCNGVVQRTGNIKRFMVEDDDCVDFRVQKFNLSNEASYHISTSGPV